ncbi:MAG: FAD binding domain-containing protein [Deltaproteobacteria bacterium]|nr:FAD binding domain-containing protein [Deltaproteobacteria bacterium]
MGPKYIPAQSLEEALDTLDRQGDKTRVLAGGTDVMVAMRTHRMECGTVPEFLLDISALPELKEIHFKDNQVSIGGAVPFRVLESHPEIQKKWPLLARASSRIGSPQVRQLATLGGNVGSASPAGDGITPLVALSAEALVRSARGSRRVPVEDLITSPGNNALAVDELIVSFFLKAPPQPEACFFDKIMRRQAVAIARMNLAVQLALDASGKISAAQIAAGAIFPRPGRLTEVEQLLLGQKPDEKLFAVAGEKAAGMMLKVSGQRSSMDYKAPALKKLVAWGLKQAVRKDFLKQE